MRKLLGTFLLFLALVPALNAQTSTTRITHAFIVPCSDRTTNLVAGTNVFSFRMPYNFTLSAVRISLVSPAAAGTFTVDINAAGVSILSTKLTIDAGEKTSYTAAVPAVLSDRYLSVDQEIVVDIDNAADGTASGLQLTLIGK